LPLAAKRIERGVAFSDANADEIRQMIERLIGNTAAVVRIHDGRPGRSSIGEKEVFRDLETRATEAHFVRRDARSESVEAGGLHLDIVRDLKRVNAHLSVAPTQ
jgi:phosphate:Na+ symporter